MAEPILITMEVFGVEIRENWEDTNYRHSGYEFNQVHREEEFIIYEATDGINFEVYQRRDNPKYRNYRPNLSNWGTYAWTCMSLESAHAKIKTIKIQNT